MISIIQDKLEAHVKENKERIEKSSSIKNLVLLFFRLRVYVHGPYNCKFISILMAVFSQSEMKAQLKGQKP